LNREATWPRDPATLEEVQELLAAAIEPPWEPPDRVVLVAGTFVCFSRIRKDSRQQSWAAASLTRGTRHLTTVVRTGSTNRDYAPGLLALREGPLLEAAVVGLPEIPEVLLVNATGRDHPRGAGLATHLGSKCRLPSVGVTDRPLVASGEWPAERRGAVTPLWIGDEVVGCWLRSRPGARPIAVSPGWRMSLESSIRVVRSAVYRARTPEPIRRARRAARAARSDSQQE
jgi:deoxyribonuclease V